MHCMSCGFVNNPNAKFCRRCGGRIGLAQGIQIELKHCSACSSPYEPGMRFCPECGKALLPTMSPLPALLAATPVSIRLPAPLSADEQKPAMPLAVELAGGDAVDAMPLPVPAQPAPSRRREGSAGTSGTQRLSDVEDRGNQIAADAALLSWQAQFERRVMPVVVAAAMISLGTLYSTYFDRAEDTDSGLAFAASKPSPRPAAPEAQAPSATVSGQQGPEASAPGQVQLATLFSMIPQPVSLNLDTRGADTAELFRQPKAPAQATPVQSAPAAGTTPIAAGKDKVAKEPTGKEATTKETTTKDVAARVSAGTEANTKVTPATEMVSKDVASTGAATKDATAEKSAGKEMASRDVATKVPVAKETTAKESTGKETAIKDVVGKDARKANGTRTKSAPDKPREEKTMVAGAEPASAAPAEPPAPQPVAVASPAVSSDPEWLVALRGDMDKCRKHGFFERTVCIERAKWKHCTTGAWGTLPECPGRKPQAEQRTVVSATTLD